MMDLSDGLSKDVATLCHDNRLGFLFDTPSQEDAAEMVDLSREFACDWRDWFFHGGEEYELLFSAAAGFDPRVLKGLESAVRLGRFSAQHSGVSVVNASGEVVGLPGRSWDHVEKRNL